jgi:hypothetical protein
MVSLCLIASAFTTHLDSPNLAIPASFPRLRMNASLPLTLQRRLRYERRHSSSILKRQPENPQIEMSIQESPTQSNELSYRKTPGRRHLAAYVGCETR